MLVGWGGNNGSTLTGTIIANRLKMTWNTKEGEMLPNYFGSITQSSTVHLGSSNGKDVYVPLKNLVPMVEPDHLVLDGWDISSLNLGLAMQRAKVFDYDLQTKLLPHMSMLKPRKAIFDPNFIAANQSDRADNVLSGTKQEQVDEIRKDIRDFRNKSGVEKVIIVWTANTERFCSIAEGLNDSAENLLMAIKANKEEISPSTLYAVASILEGVSSNILYLIMLSC
jgi:myo-inositol-1-phosphate synthase